MLTQGRSLNEIRFKTMRLLAAALACCVLQTAPLRGQVRKLHTRDLTRLSQIQVADYLKRSDIVFIPIGAVERIEPISDSRGSSAYRRRVIAVEVRRAVEELAHG